MKVRAPELFTPRRRWPTLRFATYLLANPGICPSLLATDLGSTESYVRLCQLKLGLRRISTRPGKRTA
jgi:hypothetical protein